MRSPVVCVPTNHLKEHDYKIKELHDSKANTRGL